MADEIEKLIERDERNWKIHRNKRGWVRWYQRYLEAWWIISGKWSLHRAWQDGVFVGSRREYTRLIHNKAYLGELRALSHKGSSND